jgi:hypothetical protein
MQLSAEEYECLIQSLRTYPTFGDERRRSPRTGAKAEVTIVPLCGNGTPRPVSVAVCDVSRLGIGIQHTEAIDLGRQFLLCLSFSSNVATTRMIVCIVRRLSQTPEGKFQMGCEFADTMHPELPTDEIAPGLEKHQARLFEKDVQQLEEAELKQASKPFRGPWRIASFFRRKSA